MMRRALLGWVTLAVLACEPAGSTANPTEVPDQPDAHAEPKPAAKVVPTVRDRDPEQEKKKMAQSRRRSAEARQSLQAGRASEAVSQAQAALMIHEQNVDAMLVLAEVFYKQGKYELTQAVVSSALTVDEKTRTPKDTARAYNLKGFAHAAMGQDQAATTSFKKAAEADDKNPGVWNNLGTRYLEAGDVQTAVSCFQYALELSPNFAKAHLNLGAAQRAQRQWSAAEKSFRKALKLRPNYPEAYFDLGVLYLDADPFPGLDTIKRLNKAISNLTKYRELAIADGPDGPGPTSSVATVGRGRGGKRTVKGKPAASPGPASVSKGRADDYIRVAKKGIEREERRLEREKKRGAAADAGARDPAKPSSGSGSAAGGSSSASASGSDQPPAKPAGSKPPAAKSPESDKPPAKTEAEQPSAKPGGGAASPSSPTKPAPTKPGTSESAGKGARPTGPSPAAPAPVKPTTPQRPRGKDSSSSRKSASAWNPRADADTIWGGLDVPVVANWSPRGFASLGVLLPRSRRGFAATVCPLAPPFFAIPGASSDWWAGVSDRLSLDHSAVFLARRALGSTRKPAAQFTRTVVARNPQRPCFAYHVRVDRDPFDCDRPV